MHAVYVGCLTFGLLFAIVSILFDSILDNFLDGFFDALDFSHSGAFSSTVLVSVITIFGGAGLLLSSYTTWSTAFVNTIAFFSAMAFSTLFYFLYVKPMRNSESSTSFFLHELIGKQGEIIVAVPKQGFGEVLIKAGASNTNQIAACEDQDIPFGTQVVVTAVKDGIVYVAPINNEGGPP